MYNEVHGHQDCVVKGIDIMKITCTQTLYSTFAESINVMTSNGKQETNDCAVWTCYVLQYLYNHPHDVELKDIHKCGKESMKAERKKLHEMFVTQQYEPIGTKTSTTQQQRNKKNKRKVTSGSSEIGPESIKKLKSTGRYGRVTTQHDYNTISRS